MQIERQTSSSPLPSSKARNQQQTVVPFWPLLCYSVSHLHFLIFLISVQQFLIRRSSGKSACFLGEDADSALSVRWELLKLAQWVSACCQTKALQVRKCHGLSKLEHKTRLNFPFFLSTRTKMNVSVIVTMPLCCGQNGSFPFWPPLNGWCLMNARHVTRNSNHCPSVPCRSAILTITAVVVIHRILY